MLSSPLPLVPISSHVLFSSSPARPTTALVFVEKRRHPPVQRPPPSYQRGRNVAPSSSSAAIDLGYARFTSRDLASSTHPPSTRQHPMVKLRLCPSCLSPNGAALHALRQAALSTLDSRAVSCSVTFSPPDLCSIVGPGLHSPQTAGVSVDLHAHATSFLSRPRRPWLPTPSTWIRRDIKPRAPKGVAHTEKTAASRQHSRGHIVDCCYTYLRAGLSRARRLTDRHVSSGCEVLTGDSGKFETAYTAWKRNETL